MGERAASLETRESDCSAGNLALSFFLIIFRLPAFRAPKRSLGALKAGLASRMQYKKGGSLLNFSFCF